MNEIIIFIKNCISNFLKSKKINEKLYNNKIIISKPKLKSHGDLSTNIAFLLYKKSGSSLNEFCNEIKKYIIENNSDYFTEINIINGFINFFISKKFYSKVIENILKLKDDYGKSKPTNKIYNIEMISANPTGLLHLGHGRNAFISNSVANILEYDGNKIFKEYYVNDAGNQINNLALTVYIYYLIKCKMIPSDFSFPEDCYKGEIYSLLANNIYKKYNKKYVIDNLDLNFIKISDEKINIFFRKISVNYFLDEIKKQLKTLDINIDYFNFESKFYETDAINKVLKVLEKNNATYLKDDALWISTKKFGDDKDRVLIKSDKSYTYLLPDITSHYERVKRTKPDKIINFFGADHHGYIKRLLIALSLLGCKKDLFEIQIIQMVKVINDNKIQKMSKRKGNVILLKDLLDIFSPSAIKYIFCSKSKSVHLNFDFKQLVENNENNPVFYAQYASARCSNILQKAKANFSNLKVSNYELLTNEKERKIIIEMDLFNNVIKEASKNYEPYIICDYIQRLTKLFHSYYNQNRIIDTKNTELSMQRIILVKTFSQVLKNLFNIIGVEFKNKMY